jgi:acyl-CoA thioesterase-1
VVRNAGVSGDTTTDALARLPRLLSSLAQRPDLTIVQFGANDLLRGHPLERTRANLDAVLRELERCGIPVLLAQMEPPALLGPIGKVCAAIYSELAAKHGAALHPFFPPGVLGNPSLTLRDRLHPNARAVGLVADHMLPAVAAGLHRISASAAA